ncbi:MAG: sulfotransferase [Cyanobacteria bacterium J06631_2]
MTQPNFLILGVAKSGTTSLYHYLCQHPEIFMSRVKEPNFFACEGENLDYQGPGYFYVRDWTVTDWQDYQNLFAAADTEKALGEASWSSFYYPAAVERIKKYCPQMKFILLLRNPIERAFSHYSYLRQYEKEPLTNFEAAISMESRRITANYWADWHYLQLGFYSQAIVRYQRVFAKSKFKIILYEDFIQDTNRILQEIFEFLEVASDYHSVTFAQAYNSTQLPKSQMIHRLFKTSRQVHLKRAVKTLVPKTMYQCLKQNRDRLESKTRYTPKLSLQARHKLSRIYCSEIAELEQLLEQDLSGWLTPAVLN